MKCDFLLHEARASLPRKKDHPLHKHPLILHPVLPVPFESEHWQKLIRGHYRFTISIEGMFKCSSCDQIGNGFMYKCSKKDCKFQLDTRCASLLSMEAIHIMISSSILPKAHAWGASLVNVHVIP
ncbi:unnamed protein product [Arabis nemorensis]|uniref:DC1 domain-containing protein n=1 Tax=Arabis nemorensis TaxID=586526 RepID=A0A565BH31_9BRAS|nr:unnamed protein product [Arabis nemorensis]